MKWIGQHIYDLISRFRNDVYLEDISTGTIASGGNLGLDSNNKIVKAAEVGSSVDLTSEVTGTLPVANGGTGATSLTTDGVLFGNGTSAISAVDLSTYGSIVVGGANPAAVTAANLAGNGLAALVGDGSLALNVSGLTVSEIAAGSILVAGETFADNDTSLMSAAAINDRIESFGYTTNTGDITGVDLTGAGPISISSETGTTSGDYSATIGIASASTTVIGAVELATTAETTTGTDTIRVVTPDGLKDGYQGSLNVTTVGTIGTGEWRGTAINAAYLSGQSGTNTGDETLASINALDITEVGTIDSGVWNGTAIATAYIADDAVTFAKASGVTPNIYGSIIKVLPSDFVTNDNGGVTKFGIGYVDTAGSTYGMKPTNAATELFAFVSIPEGMTATHVDIHAKQNRDIEVFEVQINADTMVSKGTGTSNTTLDITDVAATSTNLLALKITTTATSDRVFGAAVTIA